MTSPNDESANIVCRPIMFGRSSFTHVVGMPIQTARAPDALARIEVLPRFDVRETERIGWFEGRLDVLPAVRADTRMA